MLHGIGHKLGDDQHTVFGKVAEAPTVESRAYELTGSLRRLGLARHCFGVAGHSGRCGSGSTHGHGVFPPGWTPAPTTGRRGGLSSMPPSRGRHCG